MKITIKFFASLRETLKTSEEQFDVPTSVKTLTQLRHHLMSRGESWSEALAEGKAVRMALNHQMVEGDTALINQAEVAFFPPVTGG
ncbi:molybdopterin converting factor subunit 1 [Polynucleobacter sp. AM-26B4]|jgi:molybdopterin synthase sulfur carrier subunit|uniref:molybdopterin converting factor subunit 1 n=1 Tax=Polynucleobacter sp. AM-26B4 TaxID=2689103 RepID=UPI001C0D5F1A|nr:molybdopterin converting factor subunit 1 [Polynucleobacter sp. AM-26B4]MBU3584747.1 molybdopterin converting factor subunit 1 [Polynucleobacter sp. AM-26B4]